MTTARLIGRWALSPTTLLTLLGCASAQRAALDQAVGEVERGEPAASAPGPRGSAPIDELLATRADVDTLVRVALARNPEIGEARERARARLEEAGAAGRLPDPELKVEQWGVPLARPYALDEADTLMLGLRQGFPAPGVRAARARAALEEARAALAALRARRQEVRAQVQRAHADYDRADRELQIQLEHADLAARVVELTRASYQAGRGSQQDVLRAAVELGRRHDDLASLEQQRRSAAALLNTVMGRPADAPLGPPTEVERSSPVAPAAELERLLVARRPELAAAAQAIRRGEALLAGARAEARLPALMVGADYWLQPTAEPTHAYGAMVSMTLPWLNPRHRDDVRAAEHALAADRRAHEAASRAALYQLRDALERLDAAARSRAILEHDLLPQVRQSYEAAQGAYAAGQGDALRLFDALRTLLEVRLEHARVLARLAQSRADLERAVGAPIDRREGAAAPPPPPHPRGGLR